MTQQPLKSILLIDDSKTVRTFVTAVLADAGWQVEAVESITQGLARLARDASDLVLLDVGLPGANIEQLVPAISGRESQANTIVILFSGESEDELERITERCGAHGYLQKTNDSEQLRRQIQSLWNRLAGPRRVEA